MTVVRWHGSSTCPFCRSEQTIVSRDRAAWLHFRVLYLNGQWLIAPLTKAHAVEHSVVTRKQQWWHRGRMWFHSSDSRHEKFAVIIGMQIRAILLQSIWCNKKSFVTIISWSGRSRHLFNVLIPACLQGRTFFIKKTTRGLGATKIKLDVIVYTGTNWVVFSCQ